MEIPPRRMVRLWLLEKTLLYILTTKIADWPFHSDTSEPEEDIGDEEDEEDGEVDEDEGPAAS